MLTVLLTGFGPFPNAPFNPTGALVHRLACSRDRRLGPVRRIAHVFPTSYAAVDRELPDLISREVPDIVLMFGLATRTRQVRIETSARNVMSRLHADAEGHVPVEDMIAPSAPAALRLRAPSRRLAAAVRDAGIPVIVSHDAGSYLCNYLCWRASEAAARSRRPRLVAFVHVPQVRPVLRPAAGRHQPPVTLGDLVRAGEALMLAAIDAVQGRR